MTFELDSYASFSRTNCTATITHSERREIVYNPECRDFVAETQLRLPPLRCLSFQGCYTPYEDGAPEVCRETHLFVHSHPLFTQVAADGEQLAKKRARELTVKQQCPATQPQRTPNAVAPSGWDTWKKVTAVGLAALLFAAPVARSFFGLV
jgi:hypothetical protein